MTLQIGPTMELPDEAVSHTFALLAMRGAGKSNGLVVMAEAMYDAGLPWVGIDPKGDWHGIRSSASGRQAGLPIPIFGGLRGDVPLEATAGGYVADLVFDRNLTCLLDVSQFSKGEQVRFLAEFGERLYRRHQSEPTPRHIFMEEAEEMAPQSFSTRTDGGYVARSVGAWSKIVKLGRAFGLGVTMATQRSASLNKNVLTQVESLIVMRTASPQDQKQIEGWVRYHGASKEILSSMSSLDSGEAWMVSPHVLHKVERFRFARRRTFDSGATPKLGQKPARMTSLAEVDFAAIKDAMAETIEKAQAEDPRQLRKRIAELEREVKSRVVPAQPERVEVSVLTDDDRRLIEQLIAATSRRIIESTDQIKEIHRRLIRAIDDADNNRPRGTVRHAVSRQGGYPSGDGEVRVSTVPQGPAPGAQRKETPVADTEVRLGKTERTILTVLVTYGPRNRRQLALQSGYSARASTIDVALSKLRKAGYVHQGQPLAATPSGVDWLGEYTPLPSGPALLDHWRNELGKTENAILNALLERYPERSSKAEIAGITGYSPAASTIDVSMSKLRRLEIVDGWAVSEDFYNSIQ